MSASRPLSGAKRHSAGWRWAPGSERTDKTRSGGTRPVGADRGCLLRRRPGAVASARRGALWPRLWPAARAPYSHTPPHAAARRHAALPMTLVDAHRAARRDSPVLPVRIFPSVSRDPIRARGLVRPTRRRPPGRVRTGLSLTAGQIPGAPPVGSSDGVPISAGPRPGPQPPPVAAPYTDRAGFVEAGDRCVRSAHSSLAISAILLKADLGADMP